MKIGECFFWHSVKVILNPMVKHLAKKLPALVQVVVVFLLKSSNCFLLCFLLNLACRNTASLWKWYSQASTIGYNTHGRNQWSWKVFEKNAQNSRYIFNTKKFFLVTNNFGMPKINTVDTHYFRNNIFFVLLQKLLKRQWLNI